MPDILHRVGIRSSSPEATYNALTTREGLSAWWTRDTEMDDGHDLIHFRFAGGHGFDIRVLERDPGRHVRWQVVAGPEDWVDTKIDWDLDQSGDYTIALFRHEGWRRPVAFMHACSTKWALFLMSLKSLVETGEGAPWPVDVKIDEFP